MAGTQHLVNRAWLVCHHRRVRSSSCELAARSRVAGKSHCIWEAFTSGDGRVCSCFWVHHDEKMELPIMDGGRLHIVMRLLQHPTPHSAALPSPALLKEEIA